MSGYSKEVGARITMLMRTGRMTQQKFAAELGITQPAVSKYLQGRIPPPLVLLKMAQLANVSMEWILTGHTSRSGGAVAEIQAAYDRQDLNAKIRRLPGPIRQILENLVNELLQQKRKG
jgi:transcriptional regulator with XRE-family HTH domain